jgi:DNA-directed RNA polymerase specialized sigma24 family protein
MEDDFRELYAARAAALRRTAYLLCGDWHHAEDLVQVSVAELPDAPAHVAPGVEDRELLKAALLRVSPRQRACLVLRFFEDLTVAETARVLGVNANTVKSQTSRGLDNLRAVLPIKELL